MPRYDDLDADSERNVGFELADLSYRAGYGQALIELHAQNSNDARGDRIVEAANQLSGEAMWGSPFETTEPEVFK